MNKVITLLFLFLGILHVNLTGQVFQMELMPKNYDNDTIIIGNYFGERQIVKDTVYKDKKGKFIWTANEMPAPGVYIALMKPQNSFIQFMINGEEKKFSVEWNATDLMEVVFKNSIENDLFYKYMDFLRSKREWSDTLKARLERAKASNIEDKTTEENIKLLDKEVKDYQNNFIKNHTKSMTAWLIKSNMDIDIPEFEGHEDTVRYKKYFYYKDHYFDNIDMKHPALIRSPFIHPKIDYYINKVSNQQPDSLKKTIDIVLKKLEDNAEAYRYYLADFLNKYASMKMIGYDALYVHLVDNYYNKGKAEWINEDNLKKMKENADELRPILIGKKMPDITTYKEDNTPVRLYDIKSEYTVVIFWAPDCGHCKKIMPSIVNFHKKYKDKGVTMLGVCSKYQDKTKTCWPAVKEKGMEDFINTADEYGRFNIKVRITQTPKIFILDKDKTILIKDLPGEEIDRIFEDILKFEAQKNEKKV